ncbi:MAG: thiamine pyrophosphate enzyme-like TPP-binding protein [Enterovirga sp.]|jgi:sulfopyruvate decarboxylase subunit beta|nr:thiamine pyrophosphate enzyme-like TPP-binding protein [Enterovirga sp.]
MKRDLCLAEIARRRTDEIVVATYNSAFDWMRLQPHDLNYLSVGAMGLASSHALGLALGRPDRRVIVLDGDGSLLMNLGSLVTIGAAGPANLVHFVCENGTYEANGGHPIPGAGRVDFAGMAEAAGYRSAHSFREFEAFEAALDGILSATGPVFVALKVEPGEASPKDYNYIHGPETRAKFRAALNRL